MKILCANGLFYPRSDANINCMMQILRELSGRGHEITVVTMTYEKDSTPYEEYDGFPIYRVYMPGSEFLFHFFEKWKTNNRILSLVKVAMIHLLYALPKQIKHLKLLRVYRKLRKDHRFDLIFSGLCPAESHSMAYAFARKTHLPWVMYNMDSYAFNCGSQKSIKKRQRQEKRWCEAASGVVNSWGLSPFNRQCGYDPFGKLRQLEIPLPNLSLAPEPNVSQPHNKTELLYTGSFFADVRRPDELLRFLEKLDPDKYTASFYGFCCTYLRQNFASLPACVKLMGNVGLEECKTLVQNADILINVGNDCLNQMPSKVFEYIGTGKPILNFFTHEDEPAMHFLRMYPRILHVRNADDVTESDLNSMVHSPAPSKTELETIYHDALQENVLCKFADFLESFVSAEINDEL